MSQPMISTAPIWTVARFRNRPVRSLGIVLHLLFRTLFAVFWLAAAANKLRKDWLTSDILKRIFEDRLLEMPPDSFQVMYLQYFAIPLYKVVAIVVTLGELYVGVALLLGFTTRWAAGVSLFILLNLSLGGYYDASLIPFFVIAIVIMFGASGHWLGLDRLLARKYPASRWFR